MSVIYSLQAEMNGMIPKSIWLTLLFAVIISLSIFAMIYFNSRHSIIHPPKTLNGFMRQAIYTAYTPEGKLRAYLKAPVMLHYAEENSSYFEKPDALIYTSKRIPWYVTSNYGISKNGTNWVYLWGNVIIHQLTTGGHPDTKITTTALIIHPQTETAETNQPTTIIQPGIEIKGIGLNADFKHNIFDVKSEPHGNYQPNNA